MRAALALVALLPLVAAGQDDYLSYKMISSAQQPFPTYVDTRSASPAGLNGTLVRNAAEAAWLKWNAVSCAMPKVANLGASVGAVPNPTQTNDAFSVTPVWLLSEGDPDFLQILGSRWVTGITVPRAYAGVLQTCDIFFNGAVTAWSLDFEPANRMDFETVILHEEGHCLGLGHLDNSTVMTAYLEVGVSRRDLTSTDIQKLCLRYPADGLSGAPCLGDGGCSQADLKCLQQPQTNGLTFRLCSRGCVTGTNATCDLPMTCQASSAFPMPSNGACLLPGSAVTAVGLPCDDNTDCGNSVGTCRVREFAPSGNEHWVGGYCTQSCEVGQPECPAGSACVQLDVGRRCLQSCRVGLADCRPEYACQSIDAAGVTGVCIPRCYADNDCANVTQTMCRVCDGLCVPRNNVSGQIGDLCSTDATCGPGQVCRATDQNSGVKTCTQQCARGCGTCPQGSTCTPGRRGDLFCLRDCTGPATCPFGLRCADTSVGKGCLPACTSSIECPVGQYCYQGECYTPEEDASCGVLCQRPDAGRPVVVNPPDGGTGTGGFGGCGCGAVDPTSLAALVGALAWLTRRRACRVR